MAIGVQAFFHETHAGIELFRVGIAGLVANFDAARVRAGADFRQREGGAAMALPLASASGETNIRKPITSSMECKNEACQYGEKLPNW